MQRKLMYTFAPLLLTTVLVPLFASAQSQSTDLNSAVHTAITADPRSAGMSEQEISAMTAALAQQASAQGITPQAIAWRPYDPNQVSSAQAETSPSSYEFAPFFYLYIAAAGIILALAAALFMWRHHRHPEAMPGGPANGAAA